jgi:hypothetical protein
VSHPATPDTGWFTSSYSNSGGDACVECRLVTSTGTGVRDSKDRAAGSLWITRSAWAALLTTIRAEDGEGGTVHPSRL